MAGKNFLNLNLKILLCLFGTSLIGYFVYDSLATNAPFDITFVVRILTLLGFIYLLIQSVKTLFKNRN